MEISGTLSSARRWAFTGEVCLKKKDGPVDSQGAT